MFAGMINWLAVHAETLSAYGLVGFLGVYSLLNHGKVWRKAKRLAAEEMKAAADLWSPWFDLLMVATPVVWNFALRVITRLHAEIHDDEAEPVTSQDRQDVRAKIQALRNGERQGTGKSYRHLLGTQ